jgi:hypothetical protein
MESADGDLLSLFSPDCSYFFYFQFNYRAFYSWVYNSCIFLKSFIQRNYKIIGLYTLMVVFGRGHALNHCYQIFQEIIFVQINAKNKHV